MTANQTSFADHYRKAVDHLLTAVATRSLDDYGLALWEAYHAQADAHDLGPDTMLAAALVANIRQAVKVSHPAAKPQSSLDNTATRTEAHAVSAGGG